MGRQKGFGRAVCARRHRLRRSQSLWVSLSEGLMSASDVQMERERGHRPTAGGRYSVFGKTSRVALCMMMGVSPIRSTFPFIPKPAGTVVRQDGGAKLTSVYDLSVVLRTRHSRVSWSRERHDRHPPRLPLRVVDHQDFLHRSDCPGKEHLSPVEGGSEKTYSQPLPKRPPLSTENITVDIPRPRSLQHPQAAY